MDKSAIFEKIEKNFRTYKEQLVKHEGSTLAAMVTGAKTGLESAKNGIESLKETIMENEKARNTLENMKELLEKLETDIKEGDKKLSAKAVEKIESLLKEYREKHIDGDDKNDSDHKDSGGDSNKTV